MLSDNQVKEHLALAYVYAVASKAKCSFDKPSVDMDSIDVKLALRNDDDGDASVMLRSPEIALQVKAHSLEPNPTESFPFFLKKKNHGDLVKRAQTPRLLIVVTLPQNPEDCLSLTPEQLVLRRCGYWLNLTDEPATENASGVTVHLRINQRFDPETLVRLMRLAARQERLQ